MKKPQTKRQSHQGYTRMEMASEACLKSQAKNTAY